MDFLETKFGEGQEGGSGDDLGTIWSITEKGTELEIAGWLQIDFD